ncbi:putative T7SS-secreted protein [Streptomyces gobiensis]|uniref:putative T7SS-secreted protein n=1 Tax=Streptomyces gobiensis TaxID=2875706 RepID=UPI001E4BBCAC|nr:hypothetical protein [Streptomyces gobiensis]UGY93912.1 hypothetical protein test1122_20785 [Streptomyces gobiensis]
MTDEWSGLGFNPTPGHPRLATNLANNLKRTAKTLQSTHDLLDTLDKESSYWTGEASKKFSDKVADLPDYLKRAHDSLKAAGGELAKWSDALYDMKVKARHYEVDAKEAREKGEQAERDYRAARSHPDLQLVGQHFDTQTELDSAQHRVDVAQRKVATALKALGNANSKLKDLIDDAKVLERRHSDTAQDFADSIRKHADDHAPDGGILSGFKDWWDKHGGDLLTIAATAVGIAAIFVPVLAPLAIGLSLAAAGAHTYQYAKSGKDMWPPTSSNMGEWATVGGDLLGVVPGVGPAFKGAKAAISAGRSASSAARGASAVARATSTVSQATKTGAKHFSEFAKAANPSNRVIGGPIEFAAKRLGSSKAAAEMAADVTQAVVTAGLAAPTAMTLGNNSEALADKAVKGTVANNALVSAGMSVDPLQKIFSVARAL